MRLIIAPLAVTDIDSVESYYDAIRSGLGLDFTLKIKSVLNRIQAFPRIYAVRYRHVRAARIRNTQYVLYYIIRGDEIVVIAVMHGARDESAWKSRL